MVVKTPQVKAKSHERAPISEASYKWGIYLAHTSAGPSTKSGVLMSFISGSIICQNDSEHRKVLYLKITGFI